MIYEVAWWEGHEFRGRWFDDEASAVDFYESMLGAKREICGLLIRSSAETFKAMTLRVNAMIEEKRKDRR